MNKNILLYIALLLSSTLFLACEEEDHGPAYNDGIAPGVVTVKEVKPTPGGAVIKYQLPSDQDLLYVQANYILENGRKMQVRSSIYIDSLSLQGYGTVGTYPVELFAVDRGGNKSEPIETQIQTLKSPVNTIFSTIQLRETFGGVNITWTNESRSPVAFIMMALPDSMKNKVAIEEFETIYSKAKTGNMSLRGFGNVPHDFAVVVRDRWDNLSDTLRVNLTPLLEVELDKGLFKEVVLPGDVPAVPRWNPSSNSTMPQLWDDDSNNRLVCTDGDMPEDYSYTFDLGVKTNLSRMKFWQFTQGNGTYLYFDAQYEVFEVWGATELDASGSFDSWTLLKECEVVKPSGLPSARENFTAEDREIAFNGHDFEFPVGTPEVRYIRIKVIKTFSNLTWASCGEMSFYGQINE